MTELSGKAGAVLLPAAKVALHISDKEIRDAAHELAQDWRFARVQFDIHDGAIESAIPFYTQNESPELVIVETSSIESEKESARNYDRYDVWNPVTLEISPCSKAAHSKRCCNTEEEEKKPDHAYTLQ